jgi:hypothetical protein
VTDVAPLLPPILCAAGVVLFVFALTRLGRGPGVREDPLRIAGLTFNQRKEIRSFLLHRNLPEDPRLLAFVLDQAKFDVIDKDGQLVWTPLANIGFLLMPCVLYPIPAISIIVMSVQSVFLVYFVVIFLIQIRRVRNSERLVAFGGFDATRTRSRSRGVVGQAEVD